MDEQENINITGIDNTSIITADLNETYPLVLRKLAGKKIAISVSENEDLGRLGMSIQHINDISIELARYIIANGGTTIYGGDLRQGGFTYYFSELARQYKIANDDTFRFINYFPFPNSKAITREVEIDFKAKQVKPQILPLPEKLKNIDINRFYDPNNNLDDRLVFAECFRDMRIHMAKDCSARVVLGGKLTGYLGFIPGVIEEALTTLEQSKPLYLIGGFGGATARFISLIKGEEAEELSNDYQYKTDFLKEYRHRLAEEYPWMDYQILTKEIKAFNIERLSWLNKLSIAENEILFYSKNIHEILYLVIKGLKAI